MKRFKMTFQVNYTESVFIYAESEEKALEMLKDDESYSDLQVITNLKYDAELINIQSYD